jgi:hypothetical protein
MTWIMVATILGTPVILGQYDSYAVCLEQMEEYLECGPEWKDCTCEPELTQLRLESSPS